VVSELSQDLWEKCTARLLNDETTWRDEWDEKALRWTIQSLTEDSDLEPFVEGIPAFLLSEEGNGMRTMTKLMLDVDIRLGRRIIHLLMTCAGGSTLDSLPRQRRVLACCTAMWSLAEGLPSLGSQQQTRSFFTVLTELSRDPLGMVADYAHCTVVAVPCIMLRNMENFSDSYLRQYSWEPSDPFREEFLKVVEHFSEVAETPSKILWSSLFQTMSKLPSSYCPIGESIQPPHGHEWHKQLRKARFLALIDFVVALTRASSISKKTLHFFPRITELLEPREQDSQSQSLFVDVVGDAIAIVPRSDTNGSVEKHDGGPKLSESMILLLRPLLGELSDATAIT